MEYEVKQEMLFKDFFNNRDSLISKLMSGSITKREYIEMNYSYISNLKIKPFEKIDSFEKGIFNYQYYNMIAKYYHMLAKDEMMKSKLPVFYKNYLEESNYYYNEKDKTTFRLLKFLEYQNMEAYFIKMESSKLKDVLYEIVLKDFEFAILHSKSLWLLNVLKKEEIFCDEIKRSIIDYYVNDNY
ncbi:MAG: hypothetical protein JXQ26_09150 [Tissierellales bacterium]|jgi:hypothetical protein|nr:hypothetical protein [Tissierellales bacterium]MBN2828146.1 hypothetical protein [Tissierellales bacterium]